MLSCINYRACNVGSAYNHDNSHDTLLDEFCRFKYGYNSAGDPIYTTIPCYNSNRYVTLSPSLNSSGRANSDSGSWTFYPV